MFNFRGVIAIVIILLFSQQSLASYAPMDCENMKNPIISDNSSHIASQMAMHDHNSMSVDKQSAHEECDTCNAGDCVCPNIGGCFSSNISTSTQPIEQSLMHFADNGKRFLSQNEHPDSGVYLHLFKPPIHI